MFGKSPLASRRNNNFDQSHLTFFWLAINSCTFWRLYGLSPRSFSNICYIDEDDTSIYFAISFALRRGFRRIRSRTFLTVFFDVALFGRPLLGLSFTLPVSFHRFMVRYTNLLLISMFFKARTILIGDFLPIWRTITVFRFISIE